LKHHGEIAYNVYRYNSLKINNDRIEAIYLREAETGDRADYYEIDHERYGPPTLYRNYYDTTTLEKTSYFISFVDSGWLMLGLYVARSAFPEVSDQAMVEHAVMTKHGCFNTCCQKYSAFVHRRSSQQPPVFFVLYPCCPILGGGEFWSALSRIGVRRLLRSVLGVWVYNSY